MMTYTVFPSNSTGQFRDKKTQRHRAINPLHYMDKQSSVGIELVSAGGTNLADERSQKMQMYTQTNGEVSRWRA